MSSRLQRRTTCTPIPRGRWANNSLYGVDEPVPGFRRAGGEERSSGPGKGGAGAAPADAPASGAPCWTRSRTTSTLTRRIASSPALAGSRSRSTWLSTAGFSSRATPGRLVRYARASRNWACFVRKATAANVRWCARAARRSGSSAASCARTAPRRTTASCRAFRPRTSRTFASRPATPASGIEERGPHPQRSRSSGGGRDRRRAPGSVGGRARLPEDRTQPDGAVAEDADSRAANPAYALTFGPARV